MASLFILSKNPNKQADFLRDAAIGRRSSMSKPKSRKTNPKNLFPCPQFLSYRYRFLPVSLKICQNTFQSNKSPPQTQELKIPYKTTGPAIVKILQPIPKTCPSAFVWLGSVNFSRFLSQPVSSCPVSSQCLNIIHF